MAKDKNTLLNETTIRRFMKLAELAPLSESFLDNIPLDERDEDEEEMEMGVEGELDLGADLGAGEEALEEPEAEMGMEDPEAEAEVEADPAMQAKVKDFFDAVATAATDILGVDTAVESDAEPEEVEPMEEPSDMEAELDPTADDMEAGLDMEEEPEDELAEVDVVDDESIVQEVARRVIKRLLKK